MSQVLQNTSYKTVMDAINDNLDEQVKQVIQWNNKTQSHPGEQLQKYYSYEKVSVMDELCIILIDFNRVFVSIKRESTISAQKKYKVLSYIIIGKIKTMNLNYTTF